VLAGVTPVSGKDAADLQGVLTALDRAMENLFQKPALAAWKSLFSDGEIIGLKVNALAGKGLSTHVVLVEAVCKRLQEIGIAPAQIIIFDRLDRDLQRAGFTVNSGNSQPGCYGNDRAGFGDQLYEHGAVCSRISRVVTDTCDAIINLPVLKDHGIVGVSGALKNLFGLIDNPNKYHDSAGNPYVADVAMLTPIRNKVKLTICDALTAQYEGGPPFMPQWCWQMNTLIAATDMVAMDYIIWQMIEEKRREKKLPALKDAGREPVYLSTAADPQHRLGLAAFDKIDVIKV